MHYVNKNKQNAPFVSILVLTNTEQFDIMTTEKWKPKTVATIQTKHYRGQTSKLSESSVAADGSLFLFIGLNMCVDCEQKSCNAANTSNNSQSVHVPASFRD